MMAPQNGFQESCDIAIVGSGPAGIAAADTLQDAGYDCLLFDAGCLAQNIARFPFYMEFSSTADQVELGGFPLICASAKPTRREYLQYLARFCRERKLKLRLYEPVDLIAPTGDGFNLLSTARANGEKRETTARYVVVATGGAPRRRSWCHDCLPSGFLSACPR